MKIDNVKEKASVIVKFIIETAAMYLIMGLFVMFLWNAAVPQVFGLPELSWRDATMLFALLYILQAEKNGSSIEL